MAVRGMDKWKRTTGVIEEAYLCFFSSGKTDVICQGTAPALVPVTLVFFWFFSHALKIKSMLDNTLFDITLSFV